MSGTIAEPSAAEVAALREGAGWASDPRERLDLVGPDRVRFLHNLITCDVRELGPGRATRGFLTHVKGGIVAAAEIVALPDRLRLVLPAGRGEAVAAHLAKYKIAERVELERRPDLAALELRGTRASEVLAALGLPEPEAGERREGALGELPVAVRRAEREGAPRFELELAAAMRDVAVAALAREGAPVGLLELSPAALELARIESGELAWGIDYGEDAFPQETGDEAAVSYTKGCYLGQEVVARIHYRGGVQRLPRRLRFAAGARPAPGTELVADGRPTGRLTSAAIDPATGEMVGLARIHKRSAEPGSTVHAGDFAGTVDARIGPT